ncbi:MAG TPA: hypothetical protein DCL43_07880 [Chitinophagaceae bacterium]|nr:hypothetical protein [Chitinophagaceae bacterium]HAN38065.1 hypothetical protein [Chitinophagaceae bacterium]
MEGIAALVLGLILQAASMKIISLSFFYQMQQGVLLMRQKSGLLLLISQHLSMEQFPRLK